MAYAGARFGYHHPQTDSALDSKRAAFIDEDDSAVLDPSILDADIMQSPNNASFRKDSFANSAGVLSPVEPHHQWDPRYHNGALPVEPASAGASNPYHEDGAMYMRQANPNAHHFAQQHHHAPSWAFEHGSGNCTPTTGVDFMPPPPPQFEAGPYQRADSAHGSFSQAPPGPPAFSVPGSEAGFIPAPQVQTPMSPHSHQDWMGMAQQEMEGRPSHKRMRPGSPSRSLLDMQRREGIRKKNGRIDIPQERNIQTIDELIEKTTDDDLLKELKQQKRLLRNREAALASRQRKKKHTEDLEVKEKSYTQQITMLESQVAELHRERERERHVALERLQEAQRIIDTMDDEKRDLIMRHNEEASSLRKKVHILTEQLESGPVPMSATQSSTGLTDFNAEMEALTMAGPHEWDQFILANDLHNDGLSDFPYDPKPEPVKASPVLEKKASSATVTQASAKKGNESSDQPIASGLLFMLLLCGAFVASKPANSQPPDLPKMPADVRAVAPTVLSNLLAESSPTPTHEHARAVARMGHEPMPSNMPFNTNPKASRLDRMHRSITSATKQQEIDQAFALTTAQYASITNMDFPGYEQQPHALAQGEPAPPPRRNLAEALANLEQDHARNNKAEVYTRSLLWDQIPVDVVRQFKEIVRDHSEIEARQQQHHHQQQQQQQHPHRRQSNDYAFKIEQ